MANREATKTGQVRIQFSREPEDEHVRFLVGLPPKGTEDTEASNGE